MNDVPHPAPTPALEPEAGLERLVALAALGPATLAEFGPELARLAAELEAAFEPGAGDQEPEPARRMGLADLRSDEALPRHRAGLWLADAPHREGGFLRLPPAVGGPGGRPELAGGPTPAQGGPGLPPPPSLPPGERPAAPLAHDATALLEQVTAGSLAPREALEDVLERLATHCGPELDPWRALVAHRDADELRQRVRELEQAPAGDRPLAGLCFAVKANLACEGLETTAASRSLFGWRAPYTATVVRRLEAAGALAVATANMDELAMGSSGEHSAHGPTLNPWSRPGQPLAPGGSSSGSAAAVSADLVPMALGSDAGGSVRQPAAFSGVCGLRPSRGRLSRFGLVAFASSFDTVGPVARSARDLAAVLAVMDGVDPRDSTSGARARGPAFGGWTGTTVGVPRRLLDQLGDGLEPAVRASFEAALAELVDLGARTIDIELTSAEAALSAYHVFSCAEAASNLARLDGARFGPRPGLTGEPASFDELVAVVRDAGFGREVKRRILIGTLALARPRSHDPGGRGRPRRRLFAAAAETRTRLTAEFEAAFAGADLVAVPTSPTTAFPLGARLADPMAMYRADLLTVPASLAGLAAVSVPGPWPDASDALPVGVQLLAPVGGDERALAAAATWQQHHPHHLRRAGDPR